MLSKNDIATLQAQDAEENAVELERERFDRAVETLRRITTKAERAAEVDHVGAAKGGVPIERRRQLQAAADASRGQADDLRYLLNRMRELGPRP